jgi:hypothetical protein
MEEVSKGKMLMDLLPWRIAMLAFSATAFALTTGVAGSEVEQDGMN